jgi:Guanylylate cyclase
MPCMVDAAGNIGGVARSTRASWRIMERQEGLECSSTGLAPENVEAHGSDMSALNEFVARHASDVTYVRQRFQWDCGLACAEMALRARGIVEGTSIGDLRRLCDTDSIWTIDLAYLLWHFGVEISFSTLTKGVRAEYEAQPFYRNHFPEDAKRVTELFRQSSKLGINVVQQSIDNAEIVRSVRDDNALILVLTDKRLLRCPLCDGRPPAIDGGQPAPTALNVRSRMANSSFLGHYVILYAYDETMDAFLMKDPASLRDTCVVTSDTLESARSAFGTDSDIIFIGRYKGGT